MSATAYPQTYTAFAGTCRIASGPIADVALAVKAWLGRDGDAVLIFEDQTGQQLDLDLRGSDEEALARLQEHPWLSRHQAPAEVRSGPGRPKLGVTSREVSLLPRHWEWLASQPGGASAALRRLTEDGMKRAQGPDRARRARDAAAKFMWVMAGNLPAFEEAMRAFDRQAYDQFSEVVAAWPADVRDHVGRLVATARQAAEEAGDKGDLPGAPAE